jgi:hypothetical protein
MLHYIDELITLFMKQISFPLSRLIVLYCVYVFISIIAFGLTSSGWSAIVMPILWLFFYIIVGVVFLIISLTLRSKGVRTFLGSKIDLAIVGIIHLGALLLNVGDCGDRACDMQVFVGRLLNIEVGDTLAELGILLLLVYPLVLIIALWRMLYRSGKTAEQQMNSTVSTPIQTPTPIQAPVANQPIQVQPHRSINTTQIILGGVLPFFILYIVGQVVTVLLEGYFSATGVDNTTDGFVRVMSFFLGTFIVVTIILVWVVRHFFKQKYSSFTKVFSFTIIGMALAFSGIMILSSFGLLSRDAQSDAEARGEVSACAKVRVEFDSHFMRNDCYKNSARINKDFSICDFIVNDGDHLTVDQKAQCIDDVYYQMAMDSKDPSKCKDIKDQDWKEACEYNAPIYGNADAR